MAAEAHTASSAWLTGGTNRTTSSMPRSVGQVGQRGGVLEPGAGRSADDGYDEAVPQRRVLLEQHRDRAQQHVGRLERLDPAGEQQHGRVLGQAELAAGLRAAARG